MEELDRRGCRRDRCVVCLSAFGGCATPSCFLFAPTFADEDYRGVVGVILFNHGDVDFKGALLLPQLPAPRDGTASSAASSPLPLPAVSRGDRIAQLILEKIATPAVLEVSDLPETVRYSGCSTCRPSTSPSLHPFVYPTFFQSIDLCLRCRWPPVQR